MPKNKISEFSSTPANNTDIGGIDIAEGCAPSGINNAIRELMAQLKDQQAGTDADNFTVGGNLSVTGTSTLTGAVTATAGVTGNLTGNVTGNLTGNVTGNTSGTSANVTGTVAVANGGTGLATLTANNVILGNGTSTPSFVAPSTTGNVLTSNGTTWQSTAPASNALPAGTILAFGGSTAPTGYLVCPLVATNVSRTTYADLFTAIGTTWGAGDGSTTFGIPFFPADYALVQKNANLGTNHVGAVIAHTHTYQNNGTGGTSGLGTSGQNTNATTGSTGGTANLAAGSRVTFIVKF